MTKQEFFNLIGGDQVHDLCRYIIDLKFQPSFDYYPSDGGLFSVYNGGSWYQFPCVKDENTESTSSIPYDLSKSLGDQDDTFFQSMDGLFEWF